MLLVPTYLYYFLGLRWEIQVLKWRDDKSVEFGFSAVEKEAVFRASGEEEA